MPKLTVLVFDSTHVDKNIMARAIFAAEIDNIENTFEVKKNRFSSEKPTVKTKNSGISILTDAIAESFESCNIKLC